MKTRKLTILFLLVTILAGTAFSGCSTKKNEALQELTVSIGDEPYVIDPQLAGDVYTLPLINAVFEGLYRRDKDGLTMPGIAESCDVSPDGLTYTFHLRDALWADGSGIKADDFKTAWLRALDPKPLDHEPSQTANLLYYIKGAEDYNSGKGKPEEVGIEARDDKTLTVYLVKPTPFFLDLVCNSVFMPINQSFYGRQPVENNINKYGADSASILGNGPFSIIEWKHDGKIVLQKNQKYWNKDKIALDKVTFKIIKDSSAAFTEFKAGTIDVADITGDQRQECEKNGYTVKEYEKGATVYLDFNNKDPFLENVNIRKALSLSINRESLIKNLFKDNSEKALGFVNPAIYGYKDYFRKEAGDLFEDNRISDAKTLLKKGMQELGVTKIPELILLSDDTETSRRDARAYQGMWKDNLGIDVEINTMSFDAMFENLSKNMYQIAILQWGSDYNSPLGFLDNFVSDSPNNFSGYGSPEYDELVNKSRIETDSSSRVKMQIEAEKLLVGENMALCPVYFIKSSYVVNSGVKGLVRRNSAIQDMDFYWTHIE